MCVLIFEYRRLDNSVQESVIPDLVDIADEEQGFSITVASAPKPEIALPRTISELESDIDASSSILNQLQTGLVPGLDLSLLIQQALSPIGDLKEEDEQWEWDVLITKLSV